MARAKTKRAAKAKAKAKAKRSPSKASNSHGGAREGAGRKPSRLPKEMLDELGPMPSDPLEVDAWFLEAIGIVQLGVFRGEPWKEMLRDLIKSAATSSRLNNQKLQAEIIKLKRKERDEREGPGGQLKPKKDRAERTGGVRRAPE